MSRVGKQPIPVPEGVQVEMEDGRITVKGPKGELAHTVPSDVRVVREGNTLLVQRSGDDPRQRALHGLTRTLLANMVEGVTRGFDKRLELVGVGYRASKSGRTLVLNVGYSHPVEIPMPEGIDVDVPSPTLVVVKGADKQLVGQVAAQIRGVRPPEPYQGKGIRYAGEVIRRKMGKTGKK